MKYTQSFKLWHWLNAIVVLGLLGTVFLRKTFLSWRTNSELIVTKLSEYGVEITQDQAVSIAKAIRAPMWDWHIILGYALAFLVVYRIYLYFTKQKNKEKFSELSLHKKAVEVLYYVFYTTLFFMTISGLVMVYHSELGISKDMAHNIKEIHEFVFNFIMYFVILHIGGVVAAELTDEKGIISNMISREK
jgi:cytochrome b561